MTGNPGVGYLCDPGTGEPYNAETFDLDEHLAGFDVEWLESPAGRRELTLEDPLLWAVLYVPHLLKNAEGEITFGDVSLGLYRDALDLMTPAPPEGSRRAYVAPRGSAKSTTLFVITTLWLACHHPQFVAAFSASSTQAKDHLHAVRGELFGNRLIHGDYPDACKPTLNRNGRPVADSDVMLYTQSGFCFSARGVDTEVLGLVDPLNRRPAIIWLDDVEGAEGKYSAFQASQRLKVITDAILPMNDRAYVRMVGTVNMPGAIMHQLVSTVLTNDPPAEWITEERFEVTYFPPIVTKPDGTERSCWPGRWPMSVLDGIRHTRSFAKSFANQPAAYDGGYWTDEDFTHGDLPGVTRTLLSLDPSTTTHAGSDPAGLAVVGWAPPRKVSKEEIAAAQTVAERRALKAEAMTGRCLVRKAWAVKLVGEELRTHILRALTEYPEIRMVLVESNQGGEHWHSILHDMPVKVVIFANTTKKEVRAADLLHHYQMARVVHEARLTAAESEMKAFPVGAHDDMVDAIGNGVFRFIPPPEPKKQKVSSTATTYV